MARKVFVSYKYADDLVRDLNLYDKYWSSMKIITTARHYVDEISKRLKDDDHIYKGEDDGESMENLADSSISSKLGDKIFESSVTIVLISKGMKENHSLEQNQWIPWEISYSLKEQTRQGRTSRTNGVLAVVLPDENGSYEYYITRDTECNSTSYNTSILFQILRDNMFNIREPDKRLCNGSWIYSGDSSYIKSVTWDAFILDPSTYIDKAIELRDKKHEYEIVKTIQ